jgi:hypothetical protein
MSVHSTMCPSCPLVLRKQRKSRYTGTSHSGQLRKSIGFRRLMRRVLDLHSKPGDGEVDARDHRDDRANPHPPMPKSAPPTIRQKGGDHADHEGANRRRGSPAIPPHFGREGRHCGIHNIAGAMHAWKYDSERGIDGEKCKPPSPCDDIYERERGSGGKCKSLEWVDCHAPNPIMLLRT